MYQSNLAVKDLEKTIENFIPDTINFLQDIIKFPSTRGNEGPVNEFIYDAIREYCDEAELIQIPSSFLNHPDYRWPITELSYDNIQNVRLKFIHEEKRGKSLIINAHSDVVPASKNQIDAFNPKVIDGKVFGRGACDDKGQIAAIYLLLRVLKELNLKPAGELIIDFVVEEENGGNGTLFSLENQIKADAALVMEPTDLKILSSVRGAVWFELECYGKPAHSGSSGSGISALKTVINAMNILEEYHDKLLKESRGFNKLFDQFENPMPLTFGTLNAGDWPATIPGTATVKGVFGFLPNKKFEEIQNEMREILIEKGDEWLKNNFKLQFKMLNNEGNQLPEDHQVVEELKKSILQSDMIPEVSAMTAACDAWQYHHKGIPTVVMGAGSLSNAHSNSEHIEIDSIKKMTKILYNFIQNWCGYNSAIS